MKFAYPPGATPLDPDAAAGLLIRADTQQQLDEAEALNIQIAVVFLETHAVSKDFPTDGQLRELHRRMFDRVWRWAGTYRKSDTNIGVIGRRFQNRCVTCARTFTPGSIKVQKKKIMMMTIATRSVRGFTGKLFGFTRFLMGTVDMLVSRQTG